ncbi:hypothetical protein F5Y18DRAFT_430632 [Xylariaceae sp. FL1019]|nr:hypothetical protein F5Y18DRAFT_430632 [Xylariaceae sp. FL1019]
MQLPSRIANEEASSDDNTPIILIPACLFLVLCPIVVSTRIWSRRRTGGKLGPDDYTILASLVFGIASDVTMIVGCHFGYGKHSGNLTESQKYGAFVAFYITQITYKTSINLTKSSILLLYLRIFSSVRWFRSICISLLVLIGAYCIAIDVVTIFQCDPAQAAFDKAITMKKCINSATFWFTNAGFTIGTDVVILLIPVPLVFTLQVSRVQKAALIFVFTLGFFVVITSILRTTTLDLQATSPDPLYDVASTMWTLIEMSVAIICACLPQVRPLILKLFPRLMPMCYASKERVPGKTSGDTISNVGFSRRLGEGRWKRVDGGLDPANDGICLTTVRIDGRSDEKHTKGKLNADAIDTPPESIAPRKGGIDKTVQYSIEYS